MIKQLRFSLVISSCLFGQELTVRDFVGGNIQVGSFQIKTSSKFLNSFDFILDQSRLLEERYQKIVQAFCNIYIERSIDIPTVRNVKWFGQEILNEISKLDHMIYEELFNDSQIKKISNENFADKFKRLVIKRYENKNAVLFAMLNINLYTKLCFRRFMLTQKPVFDLRDSKGRLESLLNRIWCNRAFFTVAFISLVIWKLKKEEYSVDTDNDSAIVSPITTKNRDAVIENPDYATSVGSDPKTEEDSEDEDPFYEALQF